MKITTSNLPNTCWIFKKNLYMLKGKDLSKLPYITLEYEAILKANGIPYRKISKEYNFSYSIEVLEYWNPEVFEEENLTLPLFAALPDGSYSYCEKTYSGKVATDNTIKAAQATKKFVEQEIDKYKQALREVRHYKFAKEKLADKVAVVCISSDTPYCSIYDIEVNHENFKIFRPYWLLGGFSDWVAIFNMKKVAPNGYITLQVPKHIANAFIGKGGSTITAWAKEIGVKKIQVISI